MSRRGVVATLIGIAAAARLISLWRLHPLNWDEIEFYRATSWVWNGLVPYRDFFEHHTPLQWFVFAPVTAFVHSPGAAAIVAMRFAQVPVWIAAFWLMSIWMRRTGLSLVARLSAIALAICSSLFMLPAIEYRVDSLACALYALALVLLQDADRDGRLAFAGGSALCLAGLANIRLGPLLALTALLLRIVRPRERAWGGRAAANGIFAGVIVTFGLCSLYFFATHSAAIAFRRVWTENYLGDRLSVGTPGVFVHRIAGVFGFRPLDIGQRLFDPASIDVASAFILILGTIGAVRVLIENRRTPDHLFVLAFLQTGSILFIAAMKFVYTYHFEIIVLLFLPFVAAEIERLQARRWAVVVCGLLIASAVNIFASVFRGKEGDFAYQDVIMTEVDRLTPPNGEVFDGVGWALRRRSAYRYWFLPQLVLTLEARGIYEPYDLRQIASNPPSAIITDFRTYQWLMLHPLLARFAVAHYLPAWRNLWLPGMSARLATGSVAQWIVPASGEYRIYASPGLAAHPWFRDALDVGTLETRHTQIVLSGFTPASRLPLHCAVDGVAVPPADVLRLRRGQHLKMLSSAPQTVGVMIVPAGVHILFHQPPQTVMIDAAATPVPHVPHLW